MKQTLCSMLLVFFNDTATTEIYTLSLHDALPISSARPTATAGRSVKSRSALVNRRGMSIHQRSEEHTSELQSRQYLVCRLLLEKKKKSPERSSDFHRHGIVDHGVQHLVDERY